MRARGLKVENIRACTSLECTEWAQTRAALAAFLMSLCPLLSLNEAGIVGRVYLVRGWTHAEARVVPPLARWLPLRYSTCSVGSR